MSAHFKWYPSSEETTVPWNARYSFPSQSNKAEKMTPRIPPKNGNAFAPGQVIRVEFPAQGYLNPLNTTFEFDLTLYPGQTSTTVPALGTSVRVQNNVQSIFSRVRLLYGATPLEDIINYNHIVRGLTEWTATNQQGIVDQCSIAEGIGGYSVDCDATGTKFGLCNTRQKYIQGISESDNAGVPANFTGGKSFGSTGDGVNTPSGVTGNGLAGAVTRRYQINFALGLFTQDKLIPVKFMASQLAIEITLEQPQACLFVPSMSGSTIVAGAPVASTTFATNNIGWQTAPLAIPPTYGVGNVNLIPEILQFDASYGNFGFT